MFFSPPLNTPEGTLYIGGQVPPTERFSETCGAAEQHPVPKSHWRAIGGTGWAQEEVATAEVPIQHERGNPGRVNYREAVRIQRRKRIGLENAH